MRDELSHIELPWESKYGAECESRQLNELHKLLPKLMEGYGDQIRYFWFDDDLVLRLQTFSGENEKDNIYTISYSYEEAWVGRMTSVCIFRDITAKRQLEKAVFQEGPLYSQLEKAMDDVDEDVGEVLQEKMEEIRMGPIHELMNHENPQEYTASYRDAAQLITLVETAYQLDVNNLENEETDE